VLERFTAVAADRGLSLYPEQEEAILELFSGSNVILATPTGSGKSLVAAAFHFRASARANARSTPADQGPREREVPRPLQGFRPRERRDDDRDASVNPGAPVLCCTAEILANMALARGEECDLRAVIMDEFHYYSDADRGVAWQVRSSRCRAPASSSCRRPSGPPPSSRRSSAG